MKFPMRASAAGLALVLGTMASPSRADWAESTDMAVIRPMPNAMAVQAQNPPSFTWARFYAKGVAASSYTVEVSKSGTVYGTYKVTRPFYLPAKQLPVGIYTWRVLPDNGTVWSTPRSFVIDSSAAVYEVPDNAELRATVLARSHPRGLPANFKMYKDWPMDMVARRGAAFTRLSTQVVTQTTSYPIPQDSDWPVTSTTASAARAAYITQISKVVGQNIQQLEAAALLWRLTKDAKYLNEAFRRGDALAALDPEGMTSYANHDGATRQIMMALTKALDYIDGDMDATRRVRWLASIKARVTPMYLDLNKYNGRMDERPYDSHGQTAILYLSTIAALTLGDIPEASAWFDASVRPYIHSVSPWSGAEGGYGNGSGYAMFALDYYIQLWEPLANATGVNLFKKPWGMGMANMVTEFMPPNTPGLVFGDQHEENVWPAYTKAFMSRYATPAAAWYVKNNSADMSPIYLLQAPYPMPVDTVAVSAPPPNAMVLPTTGWVAMHSNISDLKRTSVYFKSSPYGSYNHSHGDQNGLVINVGNRRMLLEAGYQDYYYSPLGTSWYRETKSHNAVTYNGGVGQITTDNDNNLLRNGKITAFSTTTSVDYTEGDAKAAYGSALTTALRKVWYLRNENVVVVLDKLASPTDLTFEWNMHAQAPFVVESPTKLKMTNVDQSMCISSLSTDGTAYRAWTGPANPKWTEYHGAFVKPAASKSAEFLVVMDIGCKRAPITQGATATGRTLKVGNTTITLPR